MYFYKVNFVGIVSENFHILTNFSVCLFYVFLIFIDERVIFQNIPLGLWIYLFLLLIVSTFFYIFWGYALRCILTWILGDLKLLFLWHLNFSCLQVYCVLQANKIVFLFLINIYMLYPSPFFIFNVSKFIIIFLLYFRYHLL